VPRLWPFTRLPRLGDPFEPSLAPQTVEPLAPDPSKLAPDLRAGLAGDSPETRRSTSDRRSEVLRGVSGEATVGLRGYERAVGDLETPPERLWRGRNRPGKRATPPFEGAWERQSRRDNSGPHRRRKVPVYEPRFGTQHRTARNGP
jgi:hypothetical protein